MALEASVTGPPKVAARSALRAMRSSVVPASSFIGVPLFFSDVPITVASSL